MLEIFRNIRKLKIDINILRAEIFDIETNLIDVLDSKGFSKGINKSAHRKKTIELKKQELLLGIVKYEKFLVGKRTVLDLLNEYLACLKSELEWLNTQRTIPTKNDDYILDYNKIHQMEEIIKTEEEKYQDIINSRFSWFKNMVDSMKKHKKVISVILLFFIVSPILVGSIVSIPSVAWLEKDNDWIGFWGNYVGSISGSVIGGFVAYKVAEYGFKGQRELDKQSKITELKINNLTKFITTIVDLQQRLMMNRQYIHLTYENLKQVYNTQKQKGDETITFDSVFDEIIRSQQLIKKNRIEVYDYLEKYQMEHEISRFLLGKHQEIIQSARKQVLYILDKSNIFDALFALCKEESFSERKTIDFKNFDLRWEQFNNTCKDTDYSLYVIIVSLRNEISSELSLSQFSIEEKEAYMCQRFL